MAYGTPRSPDDVERLLHRHPPGPAADAGAAGRPRRPATTPSAASRPLAERTEAQRAALAAALDERAPGPVRGRARQKHAAPFIEDAVAPLADAGVDRAGRAWCWPRTTRPSASAVPASGPRPAAAEAASPLPAIDHWHLEPAYLDFLADAPARRRAPSSPPNHKVLFTAHSLPERVLVDDPYPDQLRESAAAVAERVGCRPWADWAIALAERGPHARAVARARRPRGHPRARRHRPSATGVLVCPRVHVRPPRGALRPRHRGPPVADDAGLGLRPHPIAERRPGGDGRAGRPRDRRPPSRQDAEMGDPADARRRRRRRHHRASPPRSPSLRRSPACGVTVLEASDRLGGKMLTTPFAGRPVDAAPTRSWPGCPGPSSCATSSGCRRR